MRLDRKGKTGKRGLESEVYKECSQARKKVNLVSVDVEKATVSFFFLFNGYAMGYASNT